MNKQRKTRIFLALTLLGCFLTATVTYALSEDLTKLLKLFGIGYVVKEFDDDIDKFINQVTRNHNAATEQATKVVPIVSVGRGGYIGAAQVTGPETALRQVKAVAQVELDFESGKVRLRGLVPVTTIKPAPAVKGVSGVGVTAIVDFRL